MTLTLTALVIINILLLLFNCLLCQKTEQMLEEIEKKVEKSENRPY